jgi:hypothetical protein
MLITNKKCFFRGILLLASFFAVFAFLLTPSLEGIDGGKKLTGLEFADGLFNSLSKGSSNFSEMVKEKIKPMQSKDVDITIPLKDPSIVAYVKPVIEGAGMTLTISEDQKKLNYKGNMGPFLEAVQQISEKMYDNDHAFVEQKYGVDKALGVTNACWHVLQPSIKELQKQKKIEEAGIIDTVVRRAIEPAHNFYSVQASSVKEHAIMMSALLIFYLVYTLWYGFGIFELFEGVGLAMTKSKVKQEG